MNQSRKQLAQLAISTAMKTRQKAKCPLHSLIDIYDFTERLGVSVFFQDIPSMEGVYTPDAKPRPAIVVSSLRPAGRKTQTCGHELGHHIFNHGTQWDELIDDRSRSRWFEPEEFLVDVFSASLQMPKLAVCHELKKRGLDPMKCKAEEMYAFSTVFGVSFGGLITHLEKSLGLIDMRRACELAKHHPKDLRESLFGRPCPQNLVVVDHHWDSKAIDVEVDDSVLLPPGVFLEGNYADIQECGGTRSVLTARSPGICRVSDSTGWASFVRICRKNYVGRAPYRFDEESEDEC